MLATRCLSTLLAILVVAGSAVAQPKEHVDGFGDPLSAGAVFRIGTNRLHLGRDRLIAIAASADGKFVAGDAGDCIGIWEVATGREVRRIDVESRPNVFLAFTPDATLLAFCAGDHFGLLDVASGKVRKMPGSGSCVAAAFASDGKVLTVVEHANRWRVRRLDVATGKAIKQWQFGADPGGTAKDDFFMPALSADGKRLAVLEDHSGETKQTVHLYDTATGTRLGQWPVREPWVNSLAFSTDGTIVADGNQKMATIRVWEAATGKERSHWHAELRGRGLYGDAHVKFAPDDASLISYGPDGLTRWDWRTGKALRHYPDMMGPVAFLGDSKRVAVQDTRGAIHILDVATGAERCPLPRPGAHVAFSPDSRLIACSDGEAIVLSDAASGREVRRWPADVSEDSPLAFSPDGSTLASASDRHDIRLWEVASGRPIRTIAAPATVTALFYSADGRRIGSRHRQEVCVWAADSGKRLGKWTANDQMAMSPDLSAVAMVDGNTKEIRLLDAVTGNSRHEWPGYSGSVATYLEAGNFKVAVAYSFVPTFSPDGRLLLAMGNTAEVGDRSAVLFWDVETGKRKPPILRIDRYMLEHLAFSPGNRLLALMRSDLKIGLVCTATGKEVRVLGERKDRQSSPPIFTPDGRLVITSDGSLVQVWEIATGAEICRRHGDRGTVVEGVLSADGRRLATVFSDHTILVWDLARLAIDDTPPAEIATLWTDLMDADAQRGRRALETLVAAPAPAVALLRERLKPVAGPDAKQLARWIADIDADDFDQRQHAEQALATIAELAEPALRQAAAGSLSLEARRRIESLLNKLDPWQMSPEQVRNVRAVQALEVIGTPEARTLLQALAKGAAGARLTREAQESLDRLAKQVASAAAR